MSEVTNANVDLITAVMDLADPRDTRHYHRIKVLCERLGTYMATTGQQLLDERSALTQDFLTLTRTVSMQAKRLRTAEGILADQSKNIRELTQAITQLAQGIAAPDEFISQPEGMQAFMRVLAHQAEQITALNATVIELMERVQNVEAKME